jgi:phosphatidylglycerophosphatase C
VHRERVAGPWAARQGLPLLATPTGWDAGRFAGLGGENCNGPEKVRRIDGALDRAGFARVWAYGDSSGDREMLALADEPSFKPFR